MLVKFLNSGDKVSTAIAGSYFKGDGWTGAYYDSAEGRLVFESEDGLGFTTGDLRVATGGTSSVEWTTVLNKPTSFTPSIHTHLWADITDKPTEFTPVSHNHTISQVTGLQSVIDDKADKSQILTQQQCRDSVAAMFQSGTHTNVSINYDPVVGTLNLSAAALERPEIVDVPPTQPTTPYLNTAFARQTVGQVETRHPLVMGYQPLVDARAFGVVPVAISAAATEAQGIANRAAMQDAIDWSHETGGAIAHPGGSVDVRGSLVQRAGLSIFGAAPGACRIKQAQQPTSLAESWTDLFTIAPVVNGATKADDSGGVGYVSFRGVHFHGGWDDLTSYQGAAEGWWQFALARMTQRLIVWDTPMRGPAIGSAGRAGGTDAHNWLTGCWLSNCAGIALHSSGRGENRVEGNRFWRSAINNFYMASPDCWVLNNTMSESGDSSMVVRAAAGDMRLNGNKFWFAGMYAASEVTGAGLHLQDAGIRSIEGSANTFQDTWGPAILASGDTAIRLSGTIDQAGGGRIEQQGFGYRGVRSQPRTCIRALGTLRRAELDFRVIGGELNGASNRPNLLHISGGGVMGCDFRFNGDLTGILPTVTEVVGSVNAKRHNRVTFNSRLIHGHVTEANLADATHGINDGDSTGGAGLYRQDDARLTDGRIATRNPITGAWRATV